MTVRVQCFWPTTPARVASCALAIGSLLAVAALPVAAQTAAASKATASSAPSKSFAAPKTPWGDPDLQGTWTSDDTWGIPMERPAQYGDRRYLTEQELAAREKQVQQTQERLLNPGDNHSPAKAQLDAITAGKDAP